MTNPMPDYGISIPSKNIINQTQNPKSEALAKQFLLQKTSDPDYDYSLSSAQLWSIDNDLNFNLIIPDSDPYDILHMSIDLSSYFGIILYTAGWAAPLNDNGEMDQIPSLSPLKRRVALAAAVTDQSMGSALSFQDDSEIVVDPGSAVGMLAEALRKFWILNSGPF
jgi:hypothetical protein